MASGSAGTATEARRGIYRSIRPAWNDFNLARPLRPDRVANDAGSRAGDVSRHGAGNELPSVSISELALRAQRRRCSRSRNSDVISVRDRSGVLPFDSRHHRLRSDVLSRFDIRPANDPLLRSSRMAGFIEQTGRAHGVEESLWMTVAVTNGRIALVGEIRQRRRSTTLYHSREMDDVYAINPDLRRDSVARHTNDRVGTCGTISEMWEPVPQNTSLEVQREKLTLRPFVPTLPQLRCGQRRHCPTRNNRLSKECAVRNDCCCDHQLACDDCTH